MLATRPFHNAFSYVCIIEQVFASLPISPFSPPPLPSPPKLILYSSTRELCPGRWVFLGRSSLPTSLRLLLPPNAFHNVGSRVPHRLSNETQKKEE